MHYQLKMHVALENDTQAAPGYWIASRRSGQGMMRGSGMPWVKALGQSRGARRFQPCEETKNQRCSEPEGSRANPEASITAWRAPFITGECKKALRVEFGRNTFTKGYTKMYQTISAVKRIAPLVKTEAAPLFQFVLFELRYSLNAVEKIRPSLQEHEEGQMGKWDVCSGSTSSGNTYRAIWRNQP